MNKNKINKHILDYAVKHCYDMWKSALSNLKNKNIKWFNIKDLSEDRIRFNLVLEPNNFSKKVNGFCIKPLGKIKSQRSLINLFNKTVFCNIIKNPINIILFLHMIILWNIL